VRLSFVIPAHNSAAWLNAAVESCLGQTYKDIEIVIVNDASTDSTPDYLAWLAKQGHGEKLKIISNEINLGRSASRNIGNRAASGDVLLVLDADDVAAPRRAELTAAKFKKGAVFVHGACHRMDAVRRDMGLMETDVFNREKALETLTNRIVHSTVAYSREFADKYPYPESGDAARLGLDDWACFIAAAMDGVKFDFIPSPIAAYRDGVGISSNRDEAEVLKFKKEFLAKLTAVPA